MCRMMALKPFDDRLHRELLENFFRLAETGKRLPGDAPGHLDGWGIGYFYQGRAVVQKSGGSVVAEERKFFATLEKIARSPILIIHLRKSAWSGTSFKVHAHPFLFENTLFAHNGTIRDYQSLLKEIPGRQSPGEALDSEVYFRYIMALRNLGLESAFWKAVRGIRKRNTYSSLTCLLADHKNLFAYREYRKHPEYYSLYRASFRNGSVVSSEPISSGLQWKVIRKGNLFIA